MKHDNENFIRHTNDLILLADDKFKIIDANEKALKFFGYSLEEFLSVTLNDIQREDKSSELIGYLTNAKKTVSILYKTSQIRKDGTEFPAEVTAHIIKIKRSKYYQLLIKDLSGQSVNINEASHFHELLKYIIEHDSSSVAVLDKEMRYIYVSERWYKDYRIKEKELIGKSHYEVFPDLPDTWKAIHRRALNGEIIRADEDPFYREDGSLDWVVWECRPWYETENKIGGIILYTEVVTEKKSIEKSLRESQELFHTLFNSNPVPTTLAIINKRLIVDINPAAEKLLGYKREEVTGKTVDNFNVWADYDEKRNAYEILLRDRKISNYEFLFKTKDGDVGTAIFSAVEIQQSGNQYLLSTFIDITPLKQARELIFRSEEKFKTVFKNNPSAIALTSLETKKITDVNAGYEKLTGYKKEEVVGKTSIEIGILRDSLVRDAFFKAILNGKSSTYVEFSIFNKNNEKRDCLVSGEIITLHDGKYIVSVMQDITEQKQTQIELAKSEERFRSTLDNMLEGAQLIGFNWRYIYINHSAEIHNRRPASELIGKKYQDMWPGIEQTHVYDVIKKCLEERIGDKMENKFIFPDGSDGWYDLNIQPVPEGVFILSIDITSKKVSELKEKKLLERLDLATRSANIGVWDWDVINNRLVWDERMYKLYGVGKQDFSGAYEAWLKGLHPEDRELNDEITHKALSGEKIYNTVLRVVWPDSSVHYLKAYGDVFRDEEGKPIRMLGVNFDITELIQAEQSARENEERLNFAMQQSHIGGWDLDVINRTAFRTLEHARIFGYDSIEQEWSSKHFFEHIYPEDLAKVSQIFHEAISEKTYLIFECRIIRKDGAIRWISGAGGPRIDSSGKLVRMVGIVRDITEQKNSQEEILNLNLRLHYLIESIKELSSTHDIESVYRIVTASAKKLTGSEGAKIILREKNECLYAEEEGIGPMWKGKRFPTEKCLCGTVMRNKKPVVIKDVYSDDRINIEDYQTTSIKSVALVPINTNDPLGAIGVYWSKTYEPSEIEIQLLETLADAASRGIENVKLYSELEQRVAERTAELTDLYNNSPCGYHSLDNDGFFVRINDTELKWLGYCREEIIGKLTFVDLLTENSREIFFKNFPAFKKQGWVNDLEFDMIRKDGSILPVLLSASAVKDKDGNYLFSRSTIVDHTERKQAEKIIVEANEKLKFINKELEAFSYSVSHDLRAPLRAIDGFTKILLEEYSSVLDSEGLRLLNIIVENANNMGLLIDDLLSFSRVSRQEISKSKINMEEMVKAVLNEFIDEDKKRRFTIKLLKLPYSYGDSSMIKQVWRNLISNAVKFSGKKDHPEIEIGALGSDRIVYYVKDNGVGFNMDFADKLFGVFQRLHSVKEYEGTGVGLAIVQRIITRHGGTIWADSQENKGTTFYFSI